MPIYHTDIEQGSLEWLVKRMGIPTASEFHKILTPKGKLSEQAKGYMYSLLAEIIVGHPITGPETDYMARGHELEDKAVEAYEFAANVETSRVGFIATDDGMIGASPDRLVGDHGLLEIKCPKENTHAAYMLTRRLEESYTPQLQGQLYVAGCDRLWVDIVAYHPEMPTVIMRVERDERYIVELALALRSFCSTLKLAREQLEEHYGKFDLHLATVGSEPPIGDLGITQADVEALVQHHFGKERA